MEDSFFGFDTSAPLEDDGGGGTLREGSEDEYDALNDETFGSAINTDWENIHENLVLLDGLNGSKEAKDEEENFDLEINLSRMKLDDVDVGFDDTESRIPLDPSVWANPIKPPVSQSQQIAFTNPEAFLRQHFPNPFARSPQVQPTQFCGLPASNVPRKICTVEDIERNIRNQQQQQQQQLRNATPKPKTPTPAQQHQQHQQNQHQQNHQHQQQQIGLPHQPPMPSANFFSRPPAPPGFSPPRPNFNMQPQHPLNIHPGPPHPQHRFPPGFPPLPLIGAHPLGAPPHLPNFPRPMPHNLPIALNNFAMHPNFNAMRAVGPPIPPPRLPPHPAMMNPPVMPNSINQFNQRLVQEIQQNHPMLANSRGFSNNHMYNNVNQQNNQHKMNGKQNLRSNGNLPDDYDEYSNLMSTRDKHWLIGIQLSQLNTDTPYIDDYYYTVFKERKAQLSGDRQSKAYKDNQLNHPLTQPKGHAQLVLISMGKNGTNSRNGQNRERKNSESKNEKDQTPRTYTPLQFENSLGKLQYGSVTAPRKIIDMEIMGTDGTPQFNTTIELSAQRKSRQLLLHIETLYRIVLKLEDLENPVAILAALTLKEKKEKQLAMEQAENDTNKICVSKTESGNNSERSSLSDKFSFELETKDKLMPKLLAHLAPEKIMGMMNVRKGKTLIRRIMPHIEDHPIRWTVWLAVLNSLQAVLKKDKDDTECILFSLYPEFKKHIGGADLPSVVKIASAMPLNDKRVSGFFASKFCISSLVAILLRAEEIYSTSTDIEPDVNEQWSQFLSTLATALNRTIQHQTINAAIESDAIQPMVNHLSRFKDLKLDSLLALFSQAKEQLN